MRHLVQILNERIVLGALLKDWRCRRQGGVGTICQYTYVLLELFHFCLEDGNFCALRLGFFDEVLHALVEDFVFVALSLDVGLQLFVVCARRLVQLILHDLGLLDEHVHHDIDLLADLVGLFLEHLQQVVAADQLVLKGSRLDKRTERDDLPRGS